MDVFTVSLVDRTEGNMGQGYLSHRTDCILDNQFFLSPEDETWDEFET